MHDPAKLHPDEVLKFPPNPKRIPKTERIVCIGVSTGGPDTISEIFQALGPDCPPIAVVQHMPDDMVQPLVDRLDDECTVSVKKATHGAPMKRGQVLIAPGDKHAILTRSGTQYMVSIRGGPRISRHKPSVDILFRSAAICAGPNAMGVILTGMGEDGTIGLGEMRAAGARTLGQDKATCVVYGMPRAAHEAGAVQRQVALNNVAGNIMNWKA